MLLVGMFGSRGVDAGVAGSEDAKDDEEAARYGESVDDGGVDGVFLDLGGCLANDGIGN